MKSGDVIQSPAGHFWVVSFISKRFPTCEPYAALVRPLKTADGIDLLHHVIPASEAYGMRFGITDLEPGDTANIDGVTLSYVKAGHGGVNNINALLVAMRDSDDRLHAFWRWQVALAQLAGSLSFLCAEQRDATEDEF